MTLHNYRSTTAYDDHRGPEPDEDAPRVEVGPSVDAIKRLWIEVHHQEARTETGHQLAFARALLARYGAPQHSTDARVIEAARNVLYWTETKHRPPVRESFPVGEMARVRVHALADLHDALKSNPAEVKE